MGLHNCDYQRAERGFSIIEMLVGLLIFSILSAMAISNLMQLERPLVSAASQTSGFLKQARAKAVATTSAYRVYPANSSQLAVQSGVNCDAVLEDVDGMLLTFPSEVVVTNLDWEICFTPRGLANDNIVINLEDNMAQVREIEVYMGGAIRLLH